MGSSKDTRFLVLGIDGIDSGGICIMISNDDDVEGDDGITMMMCLCNMSKDKGIGIEISKNCSNFVAAALSKEGVEKKNDDDDDEDEDDKDYDDDEKFMNRLTIAKTLKRKYIYIYMFIFIFSSTRLFSHNFIVFI